MDTVKDNRNKYLGGSDIPAVFGISPYCTRYELLLKKLGVLTDDFEGNQYTEYGIAMEPKIREHLNETTKLDYKSEWLVDEDKKVRCNVDGISDHSILEIKTSTKPDVDNKTYLSQLWFYMHHFNKLYGTIAVYQNKDFDTNLNEDYLQVKNYHIMELQELFNLDLDEEIQKFWKDYETLESYLELGFELNESMIINNDIQTLSTRIINLEKELEKPLNELKELKEKLLNLMIKDNAKTFQNNEGYKITMVAPKTTIKIDYDFEKLKQDIDLKPYEIEKEIKRNGSIRITKKGE